MEDGLELFLVSRPFGCNSPAWLRRLPGNVQGVFTGLGFCHYMVVVRCGEQLTQYDFGPVGCDLQFSRGKRAVIPGEVREMTLTQLPPTYLRIGSSAKQLEDIRAFNQAQQMPYRLHKRDCRHFAEDLIAFAVGQQRARQCPALIRWQVRQKRAQRSGHGRLSVTDRLTILGAYLTDCRAWPVLQAASRASKAALSLLLGRALLARLPPAPPLRQRALLPAVPSLPAVHAAPLLRRPGIWRHAKVVALSSARAPLQSAGVLAAAAAGAMRHLSGRRHRQAQHVPVVQRM